MKILITDKQIEVNGSKMEVVVGLTNAFAKLIKEGVIEERDVDFICKKCRMNTKELLADVEAKIEDFFKKLAEEAEKMEDGKYDSRN